MVPTLLLWNKGDHVAAPGRRRSQDAWISSGPGARSASTRVAARPREREPGALAGPRGSGRQQAHRQLPQSRQRKAAGVADQNAGPSRAWRRAPLANTRARTQTRPEACFGVVRCFVPSCVRAAFRYPSEFQSRGTGSPIDALALVRTGRFAASGIGRAVNGHRFLRMAAMKFPVGGHRFSRRGWPSNLPTRGHRISPPGVCWGSGQRRRPS